jgi:hypothetical protein
MNKAGMERAAELLLVQLWRNIWGSPLPPFGDAPFFLDAPGGDELIAKGAINMLSGASRDRPAMVGWSTANRQAYEIDYRATASPRAIGCQSLMTWPRSRTRTTLPSRMSLPIHLISSTWNFL